MVSCFLDLPFVTELDPLVGSGRNACKRSPWTPIKSLGRPWLVFFSRSFSFPQHPLQVRELFGEIEGMVSWRLSVQKDGVSPLGHRRMVDTERGETSTPGTRQTEREEDGRRKEMGGEESLWKKYTVFLVVMGVDLGEIHGNPGSVYARDVLVIGILHYCTMGCVCCVLSCLVF